MKGLTADTWALVCALFPAQQQNEAGTLLVEECGRTLPLCRDATDEALERIRFAVLRSSAGDLDRLCAAIVLAQQDWRDALVAAGFGHSVTAHRAWFASVMDGSGT